MLILNIANSCCD